MTLRSYIRKRMYWCCAVAVAGWLLIPVAAILGKDVPGTMREPVLPVLGFLMFGGPILVMQRVVRCPKCKANLARTIAMPVAFTWGSGPRVNFCPYCGVSLDQELPQAKFAGEIANPIHPE
jgi:hypothetical protein